MKCYQGLQYNHDNMYSIRNKYTSVCPCRPNGRTDNQKYHCGCPHWTTLKYLMLQYNFTILKLDSNMFFCGKNSGNNDGITAVFYAINTASFFLTPNRSYNSGNLYINNNHDNYVAIIGYVIAYISPCVHTNCVHIIFCVLHWASDYL